MAYSLNQLSTSADKNANEFVEYTYDTKGNITQKKNYSLTSSLTKGTLKDTKTYTYGDTNWGDKLTSYNGTTITYDNIGNPTSYRDGMTMSWMVGRSLSQITKSNKTYSFKYNADGLRTEKKCVTDGDTHHYYYDSNGNMIAYRRNNGAVVYFYYDSQGNVTSMSFEGTKYFFIKNIQGDVEKIVTHQGNVAVTYKYDAWGKLISKTDNTVYGIGELNPFRYRGYIYDDETGLYYLKSRYYDPQTDRFLNEDDTAYIGATGTILSTNVFSYCENDPVNMIDYCGFVPYKITQISINKLTIKTSFWFTISGSQLATVFVLTAAVIDIVCLIITAATGGTAAPVALSIAGIVSVIMVTASYLLDKYGSKIKIKVTVSVKLKLYKIKIFWKTYYGAHYSKLKVSVKKV